jgi:ERCC4-type nuclease
VEWVSDLDERLLWDSQDTEYTNKMSEFTIYTDNREKQPYKFNRYPVEVAEQQLKTGDYCVEGDGRMITENVFDPHYAVERKNKDDFLQSISWERDRFEEELSRADSFARRMPVVVESPWSTFKDGNYWKNISFNTICDAISDHHDTFCMKYILTSDKQEAEEITFEFLEHRFQRLPECY